MVIGDKLQDTVEIVVGGSKKKKQKQTASLILSGRHGDTPYHLVGALETMKIGSVNKDFSFLKHCNNESGKRVFSGIHRPLGSQSIDGLQIYELFKIPCITLYSREEVHSSSKCLELPKS